MLTYLTRKRGYTLTSKLEGKMKAEQQCNRNNLENNYAIIPS